MSKNKLYGTDEISKMLEVHIITVQKWFKSGKLDGVKIGDRWVATKAQIDKFTKDTKYE